ncbi:MAG: hypothetical protein JW913_12325 [Chitinispirillaceae bacterium]|nr:hypothetical protein [Chitinispirillaceae bacterium]
MKENDARVDYDPHQLLLYVEKEDGTYGPLQTGAYAAKNYLGDFIEKRGRIVQDGIEKLKNGQTSPVAHYLQFYSMTTADLAARAAVPLAKVKKHLTPAGFAGASLDTLRRYAEVFDLPLANLFALIVPKKDGITITARKTTNPLFTIIEIS